VFLTSLTMRGFKSFADATTMEVEPGITVIVGPNGSGKSNVVDALSWVLGTASPSKVRGGTMTDVVFAGSPDRRPASAARVEITIDNSAGVLGHSGVGTSHSAQEFTEVSVSREIDRDGGGTYRINNEVVRALDVQELLSDTGLGRELHTIVGQGQLDEILNARPEDRRRYIEEAAGILKHRRRRERSVRKLEQVDEHIHQLSLVLRELSRQLKPLQRQAEQADRHKALQAQLRAVRLELAAHDLDGLLDERARHADTDEASQEREAESRHVVENLRAAVAHAEAEVDELGPAAEQAQTRYHQLNSLKERWQGTSELVTARRRHLTEHVEEPLAGRPPDELRAAADRADAAGTELDEELATLRARLDEASTRRREAETRRRAHEQARAAAARQRALARERHVRWEGQVAALAGSVSAAEAELGRSSTQRAEVEDRRSTIEADLSRLADDRAQFDDAVATAEQDVAAATAELDAAQATVDDLLERERGLERERTGLVARAEALRATAAEQGDGAQALLDGADGSGVDLVGQVADHVRVDESVGAAVAAILGSLGEAVVAPDEAAAAAAVAWIRRSEGGGVTVIAAAAEAAPPPELDESTRAACRAAGAVPVSNYLQSAGTPRGDAVVAALATAVRDAVVIDDWRDAVALHAAHPHLTVATTAGDVASPRGFVAASTGVTSAVLAATAADEAEAQARDLASQVDAVTAQVTQGRARLAAARDAHADATDRRHRLAAQAEGARDAAARLAVEQQSVTRQLEVVTTHRDEITAGLEVDRNELSSLRGGGPPAFDEQADEDVDEQEAAELDEAVGLAREHELDARVDVERVTEQVRGLAEQARQLRSEATEVEAALAAAARRRERRRRDIARCGELATVCQVALEAMQATLVDAAAERDALGTRLGRRRSDLAQARAELGEAETGLADVRELRHAAELARADLDHRIEAITDRLRADFGITVDDVMADHPDAAAADRDALVAQEDTLVRRVGLLGRVNPLALEEFKALEERHAFLAAQVDDLRQSRRDLEGVIDAVDDRIRTVFMDAWTDIEQAFERIFSVVFPGGHGRLRLVGEEDPLTAGIEVEARPPGKKVTRLSLLSGGERSLTVLAFVFAIFMARPSPFYVLDEVDAALDDVNLQRLLQVIESFRGSSQIIMVTHQKRSMEIADVLYGITMGADAVTKVVAQRLGELEASGVLDAAG